MHNWYEFLYTYIFTDQEYWWLNKNILRGWKNSVYLIFHASHMMGVAPLNCSYISIALHPHLIRSQIYRIYESIHLWNRCHFEIALLHLSLPQTSIMLVFHRRELLLSMQLVYVCCIVGHKTSYGEMPTDSVNYTDIEYFMFIFWTVSLCAVSCAKSVYVTRSLKRLI